VSRKPVFRVRKSGALLVAALIAVVGTIPFAGVRWALAPILLIPLAVLVWAWRAGTDIDADSLRVRALLGTTEIGWDRVAELAPGPTGQVSALLTDGRVVPLTGVTAANLPAVLRAGGQQVTNPDGPEVGNPGDRQVTNPDGQQVTNPDGQQVGNPGGQHVANPGAQQVTNRGGRHVGNPGEAD
jgi:hypothetical protein